MFHRNFIAYIHPSPPFHLPLFLVSTNFRNFFSSLGKEKDPTFVPNLFNDNTPHLIMPKNKGKGGKNRRRGKNENENEKRELVFKEDGQEYAQVSREPWSWRLVTVLRDSSNKQPQLWDIIQSSSCDLCVVIQMTVKPAYTYVTNEIDKIYRRFIPPPFKGDENVGQRSTRSHVLRWNETIVSHQRKTTEKSVDKSVGHHPHRFERLPGGQGNCWGYLGWKQERRCTACS